MYRSLIYAPGNNEKIIHKAIALDVDGVILDLEDSVPEGEKESARNIVSKSLLERRNSKTKIGVRINGLETPHWKTDLATCIPNSPDFVVLPKIDEPADLAKFQREIESLELKHGLKKAADVIALIESARGIANIFSIAASSKRISAIVFGRADYAVDVGCGEEGLALPRQIIPIAAAARGIVAIDSVFVDLKNLEGLRKETENGKMLGYVGKTAIHPSQVPIINEVYAIKPEEMKWAREVLSKYEESVAKEGKGATKVGNEMIDLATVKRAKRIIERSE